MFPPGATRAEKKALRTAARTYAKVHGLEKPQLLDEARIVAPPPICNRAAAGWSEPAAKCDCKEWPQWVLNHQGTHVCREVKTCLDSDGKEVVAGGECLYWRPSGQKRWWWYNGKVYKILEVKFGDRLRPIVVIN